MLYNYVNIAYFRKKRCLRQLSMEDKKLAIPNIDIPIRSGPSKAINNNKNNK